MAGLMDEPQALDLVARMEYAMAEMSAAVLVASSVAARVEMLVDAMVGLKAVWKAVLMVLKSVVS